MGLARCLIPEFTIQGGVGGEGIGGLSRQYTHNPACVASPLGLPDVASLGGAHAIPVDAFGVGGIRGVPKGHPLLFHPSPGGEGGIPDFVGIFDIHLAGWVQHCVSQTGELADVIVRGLEWHIQPRVGLQKVG